MAINVATSITNVRMALSLRVQAIDQAALPDEASAEFQFTIRFLVAPIIKKIPAIQAWHAPGIHA
jgi:hypothetical protein